MLSTLVLLALAPGDAQTLAGGAIQPHLAGAPDGTFACVFIREGNIEITVSTDQGKTWSRPTVALDARGRARGGLQRGPRVALDAKKTIYVTAPLCFDEAELAKKYPVQDLYLAVSTDGGKTFSKPALVNDVPRKAPESLHWLAAAPTGDVFVAWLDLRSREKGQDLAWARITDGGRKIGKNQILPGPLCECCAPGLAVDPQGNPTVVYRESKAGNRAIFLAASSNQGSSFSKIVRLNQVETKVDT